MISALAAIAHRSSSVYARRCRLRPSSTGLQRFVRRVHDDAAHTSDHRHVMSCGSETLDPAVAARRNPAAMGRKIRGVVFDMDGTLTVPCIDFAEMRRRVGVHPTEGDILKIIQGWEEERQREAYRVIAEIEEQALRDMQIMGGAVELCRHLDDRRMPRAIVTRNVMSSVDFFHDTHFPLPPFKPSLSREWQPYKPDPASLHFIAEQWNIESAELVMIGDSCRDDIGAGANAGATTILIDEKKVWHGIDDARLPVRPDFIVHDLFEAAMVLSDCLELIGGAGDRHGSCDG